MGKKDNWFEEWRCKVCGLKHTSEFPPFMDYLPELEKLRLTCIRCGATCDFVPWKYYQ